MRPLFPSLPLIFLAGATLLWAGDAPTPSENLLTLNESIKAALSVDPEPILEQLPEGGLRLKYMVPESLEEQHPVGDINFEFNPPIQVSAATVEIPSSQGRMMLQVWNENGQHSAKSYEPGMTTYELDFAELTTGGEDRQPWGKNLAKFRITFPVDKAPGEHIVDVTKFVLTP